VCPHATLLQQTSIVILEFLNEANELITSQRHNLKWLRVARIGPLEWGAHMGKTAKQVGINSQSTTAMARVPAPPARARGQKPMVAMSFRISRQDWERLHLLAISDGVSINTLTLRGLSRLFEERGLPGIGAG